MKKKILDSIIGGVRAIEQLALPKSLTFIEESAHLIATSFTQGNKLLVAGNGGSLCDAAHVAEEFVGIFRTPRPALPALALSDPGILSCVGNDLGFDAVFSRAIEAYGKQNDLFLGLSTSGNSQNIVSAFRCARAQGLKTIALLGRGGGKMRGMADLELVIEGFTTSDRIQEAHMAALHILVEMVEELLFATNSGENRVESLVGVG